MQMIDVLKRLAELDNANPNRPEYKVEEVQSISALPESVEIAECGMMPSVPPQPAMPASINMSAGSGEELGDLIRAIATLAGSEQKDHDHNEPLSTPAVIATTSPDGPSMRSMLDTLNPIDMDDEEETDEAYDNTPADPTDANEFDAEQHAVHLNPPGAATGRGNMNNPRAVPTMEEIERDLVAEYQKFIGEN